MQITCPVCGHRSKADRVGRKRFKCLRCGFTFNAQYVACLNLASRLYDGRVAIRGGRIYFIARKAGLAVSVDVALNEPLIEVSG